MAARATRKAGEAATSAELALYRLVAEGGSDGRARKVSARFLEAMLAGRHGPLPGFVLLENLTVEGAAHLPLGEGWAERDLCLRDCRFDGRAHLDGRLRRLTITGCEAPALSLRRLTGEVVEIEGLTLAGHLQCEDLAVHDLRLRQAEIGGMVALDGGSVAGTLAFEQSRIGSGKASIQAEGLSVGRQLRLGGGGEGDLVLDGVAAFAGARIGALVTDGAVRCEAGLDLRRAALETLSIGSGAVIGPVQLDRARLGDMAAADGSTLVGPVSGEGCTVAGGVVLAGAHEVEPGPAVDLAGATVAGAFRLGDSFESSGAVRLAGCEVGGATVLQGRLRVPGGNGLDFSRVAMARLEIQFEQFAGGISMRQSSCTGLVLAGSYRCPADAPLHLGLACSGRVSIGGSKRGARISGALSLIGHACHELILRRLKIEAAEDGPWAGVAVAARHLAVETLTRIGHPQDGAAGVELHGLAALDYARLGDDVRLAGVRIVAPERCAIAPPRALSLRKAQIAGDLELGVAGDEDTGRLDLHGDAGLSGLSVGGDLAIERLFVRAGSGGGRLDLSSSTIAGALRVGTLDLKGVWSVDLSDSRVGRLDDDHGLAWAAGAGAEPAIMASTLVYERIETRGRDGTSDRLAWLARRAEDEGGFSPQPYRTLIAALGSVGDAGGVRRASLASLRQLRRLGSGPRLAKIGNSLLDLTSGYGYLPTRAALTVLIYFLIGWAGTETAVAVGVFQASPFMDGSVLAAVAQNSPDRCPWMQPPLYALDLMVPMTTLGNEAFCTIRPEAEPWHWATILYRLGGWVLLSIALLTFAGILKRDV